jgi:dipeptidyl aminopeptidase/acylaminoacyl peptidase
MNQSLSVSSVFLTIFSFAILSSCDENPVKSTSNASNSYNNSDVLIGFNHSTVSAGSNNLWVMDLNGSHWEKLTQEDFSQEFTDKVFSHDASKIVASAMSQILVFDVKNKNVTSFTSDLRGIVQTPDISPDDSKITFSNFYKVPGGYNRVPKRDIYIINIDGSNLVNLTNSKDNLFSVNPSFSPNGDRIIFVSYQIYTDVYLYNIETMNVDGSNRRTIFSTKELYISHPSFFPGEDKILFLTGESVPDVYLPVFGIHVCDSTGSNYVNLTEEKYFGTSIPDISDNGDKIVSSAVISGEERILLMNSDGSNKVVSASMGRNPKFSPNAKYIVYDSHVGVNNYDIFRMDLDGENNTNLTKSSGFYTHPIIQAK